MGAGTGVFSNAGQNATSSSNPYANTNSPYIQAAQQTALGNLAGAQAATSANRVNQSTPYANLNYAQTGTDANGNPIYSANQTLNNGLQSGLQNISSNVINASASPFGVATTQNQLLNANNPNFQTMGNAPTLQSNAGGTGLQGWNQATQDVMSSLQPQLNQQNEQLTNSLAQQGIQPGTQAYNNAMQLQAINQNNLLAQASLTGANVQNNLVNQGVATQNANNSALTQQNQNQLANLGLNNQYAQQGFANAVTGQQANNSALQNNYTQNLAAYNNPLQQLAGFNSATNPGYITPYNQTATTGPDYNAATQSTQNSQIAANNAALGQSTNLTSGLFGLGSSAISATAPSILSSIGL
jgi:hypothetical protein